MHYIKHIQVERRNLLRTICFLAISLTPVWAGGCSDSANGFKASSIESASSTQIVFVVRHDKNSELHVMDLDGRNQKKLATIKTTEYGALPKFSPDRQHIAYISWDPKRYGVHEIYLVRTDGTSHTRVTKNTDMERDIGFSPDSRKILYSFTTATESPYDIGLVSTDGTGTINLTKGQLGDYLYPTFSPDGKRIAYAKHSFDRVFREPNESLAGSEPTDFYGIATINTDGDEPKGLVKQRSGLYHQPAYSPNGRRVTFVEKEFTQGKTMFSLYSVNVDGSDLKRLFNSPFTITSPKYSPDSQHITFTIDKENQHPTQYSPSLYIMRADGKNLLRLIKDAKSNQSDAVFTPDSQKIVFESWINEDDSRSDICIIDIDGSYFVNLTKNTGGGSQPDVR